MAPAPTAVSGTPHIMKALIEEWTVHLSTTHERSPPQPLSPQPGQLGNDRYSPTGKSAKDLHVLLQAFAE